MIWKIIYRALSGIPKDESALEKIIFFLLIYFFFIFDSKTIPSISLTPFIVGHSNDIFLDFLFTQFISSFFRFRHFHGCGGFPFLENRSKNKQIYHNLPLSINLYLFKVGLLCGPPHGQGKILLNQKQKNQNLDKFHQFTYHTPSCSECFFMNQSSSPVSFRFFNHLLNFREIHKKTLSFPLRFFFFRLELLCHPGASLFI